MSQTSDSRVIRVVGLRKYFAASSGLLASILSGRSKPVKAVDGVDLEISRAEVVSLVGESGSGKTTLGEITTMLLPPSQGKVFLRDVNLADLKPRRLRRMRRHIQIIFQDPFESLNPRMTVYRTVAEPVLVNEKLPRAEVYRRVVTMLNEVGLAPAESFLYRFPTELSGGQRQRVAIARALILKPDFVVADEPVSMLDVSVAAGILNLMLDLRAKLGTAFLFITHDLGVAGYVGDRVATMFQGRIVEIGSSENVMATPLHPYTQLLISAIPVVDPTTKRSRLATNIQVTDRERGALGCKYQFRCPWVMDVCRKTEPDLMEVRTGHFAACFKYTRRPN
jgi:peptide/nickel transport system ATP-binding protein